MNSSATSSLSEGASVASRTVALRLLLTPAQLRESARLAPVPVWRIAWWTGAQAGLALFLAAALCHLSPWSDGVGYVGLGVLAALFGRFQNRRARLRELTLCVGLLLMAVVLPSLVALSPWASSWTLLVSFSVVAALSAMVAQGARIGAPGVVIVAFAAGAAMAPVTQAQDLLARVLATGFGGGVALAVCWLTDGPRVRWLRRARLPAPPAPGTRADVVRVGLRVALASGGAAALALAGGAHHFAWAGIGAVAVVQSTALHLQMNRALQRTVGTCVGALLAWAVLSVQPTFWVLLLCIALLQWFTEAVIGYNYALGQATVTPMALLMTALAMPAADPSMAVERVFDTMIGAALGMTLALILSSHEERRHLLHHRQGRR